MAAPLLSPYVARDEIRLSDAVELLRLTNHPMSKSTLERQCRARGVALVRQGKDNYASWTEVLKVHRDWVDAKQTRR